jgi:hypothetical protein
MKPDWRIDLSICTAGCTVERIGHSPREESIYRSLTGGGPLGIAALEDKIVQQAVGTLEMCPKRRNGNVGRVPNGRHLNLDCRLAKLLDGSRTHGTPN